MAHSESKLDESQSPIDEALPAEVEPRPDDEVDRRVVSGGEVPTEAVPVGPTEPRPAGDTPATNTTATDSTAAGTPAAGTAAVGKAAADDSDAEVFSTKDIGRYQDEWRAVQTSFVDDPEAAVREADALVERVVGTLTSRLTELRTGLATGSDDTGQRTEELRLTLRRYRSMFRQLVRD